MAWSSASPSEWPRRPESWRSRLPRASRPGPSRRDARRSRSRLADLDSLRRAAPQDGLGDLQVFRRRDLETEARDRARRRRAEPSPSQSAASSVASRPDSRARARSSARNACGVPAATEFARSSVAAIRAPSTLLTVSGIGIAAIAAPVSSAALKTAASTSARRHERARRVVDADHVLAGDAPQASKARRTDWPRECLRPATTFPLPRECRATSSSRPGGAAMTVPANGKGPENASSVQERSGLPEERNERLRLGPSQPAARSRRHNDQERCDPRTPQSKSKIENRKSAWGFGGPQGPPPLRPP